MIASIDSRAARGSLLCAMALAALAAASARAADASLAPGVFQVRGMPYEAFDRLPATRVTVQGAALDVAIAPGIELALPQDRVLGWVYQSARALADYLGRFPVERARVLIVPTEGSRIRGGSAYGHFGAAVRVAIGRDAGENELRGDWVMTHEMVHLALPSLAERHDWVGEGLATYVAQVVRAQAGQLAPEDVWADLMQGLPLGLPGAGDPGLDRARAWRRTYWGGALYWLLADVEIRSRSGNRFGLARALRGIVDAGGSIEIDDWPLEKVLQLGDAATGVPVLAGLYQRMRAAPTPVDLAELWGKLGVRLEQGRVVFDGHAPLAAIRDAITASATHTAAYR